MGESSNENIESSIESGTEASPSGGGKTKPMPSPFNCISGSAIAGAIAVAMYFLTTSIATSFAAKPLQTANPLAQNISSLVRTTVLGVSALGTGVFTFVALGLLALGIQILVKGDRQATS